MNTELRRLTKALTIDTDQHLPLRLAFGIACAERIRELLLDPRVIAALDTGQAFLRG